MCQPLPVSPGRRSKVLLEIDNIDEIFKIARLFSVYVVYSNVFQYVLYVVVLQRDHIFDRLNTCLMNEVKKANIL